MTQKTIHIEESNINYWTKPITIGFAILITGIAIIDIGLVISINGIAILNIGLIISIIGLVFLFTGSAFACGRYYQKTESNTETERICGEYNNKIAEKNNIISEMGNKQTREVCDLKNEITLLKINQIEPFNKIRRTNTNTVKTKAT